MAAEPLPANTTISVSVGPGTPSAEGPLVTSEVQSFGFRTYAPLKVADQNCRTQRDACPPGAGFYIRFNNPIDVTKINNDLVTVEPEIPGMVVSGRYDSLSINGLTAGRTTYNVTLSPEIADIFGQTLGEPVSLTFYTGSMRAFLTGPSDALTTLDPTASVPAFTVYSVNMPKLARPRLLGNADDWPAYLTYPPRILPRYRPPAARR